MSNDDRLAQINARLDEINDELKPIETRLKELMSEKNALGDEKKRIQESSLVLHRVIEGDHDWRIPPHPRAPAKLIGSAYVLWSSLDEESQRVTIYHYRSVSSLSILRFPVEYIGDRINE